MTKKVGTENRSLFQRQSSRARKKKKKKECNGVNKIFKNDSMVTDLEK